MRLHFLIATSLLLSAGSVRSENDRNRTQTTPQGRDQRAANELAIANNQFSNDRARRQDALASERDARLQARIQLLDDLKRDPPTTKTRLKPLITFMLGAEGDVREGTTGDKEFAVAVAKDAASLNGIITTSLAANSMFDTVLAKLDTWKGNEPLKMMLPVFSVDQQTRAGEGKRELEFNITYGQKEFDVAEALGNEFVGLITRPSARILGAMAVKGDPVEPAAPATPPVAGAPTPAPFSLDGHYKIAADATTVIVSEDKDKKRDDLRIANAEVKVIFEKFKDVLAKDDEEFKRKQQALDSEKAPGSGAEEPQQQAQETPPETPPGGAPPGGGNQSPSQAKAPTPSASQAGISSMGVGGQAPNDVVSGIGSLGSYLASQLAPFLNKDPHPTSSVKVAGTPNSAAQPPGEFEKTSAGERRPLGNSSPGSGIAGGAPSNNANDAAGAAAPNGLAGISGGGNGAGGGGFPEGINGGDYGGSDGKPNSSIDVAYASGGTVDGGGEPSISKANPPGDFVGGGMGGLFAQLAPQRLVGNVVSNVKAGLVQAMHGQWAAKHCGDSKYSDDSFCLVAKTKTRLNPPSRMPASLMKKQGELGA